MSRGNQREVDRQKRQAKEASKNKATREGTPLQRNENDALKLQAKVAAKQAQKTDQQDGGNTTTKAPVPRKKVPAKKSDNLDDLLNAGLTTGKKTRK